ncbi:hypothetical protein J3D47_005211 [Pseudomonas laurylsulfativorans]|uniref:Arm DNA-binding domain-containing protein n=1 Tax=Pseudomonas laurylsulfativorans TaxID=1943631 RepID=UPI0020A127C7|nr:Arm DNA-binding domain-containing protein [Pseudomonas laurylsulfativorans]MCP1420968.1 hypothetical protein [Pseudomonas laurylsulfativorans]
MPPLPPCKSKRPSLPTSNTLGDSSGLALLVQPNGRKYWHFRYTYLGLPAQVAWRLSEHLLQEALERAAECRKLLKVGRRQAATGGRAQHFQVSYGALVLAHGRGTGATWSAPTRFHSPGEPAGSAAVRHSGVPGNAKSKGDFNICRSEYAPGGVPTVVVNEDVGCLRPRGVLAFFASRLAPTGLRRARLL